MITMNPTNVLPPTAVALSARELMSDGVHLAELQCQLAAADWRKAKRLLITLVACAFTAVLLLLTLLPVAFACAALVIHEFAGLSLAASFGIVVGVGLLLVAACVLTIWLTVRNADSLFQESRRELARNVDWFKRTLRGHE